MEVLRVLAILLVFGLHCVDDIYNNTAYYGTRTWYASLAVNSVCRAGVPLFLMISGYFSLNSSKTTKFAVFYKKRFSRIVPPLLIWNVIYFSLYTVEGKISYGVVGFFEHLINNGNAYHMWYIYTLLGIYLIAPFLKKLVDELSTAKLVLFFFISILASTLIPFINTVLPVYIYLFDSPVNGYIGFFILGYILGKNELSKISEYIFYALGIIGCAINILGNILHSSPDKIDLPFNYAYSLTAYLVSAALFVFCKCHLYEIKRAALRNMITRVSTISFGIYWAHIAVLDLLVPKLLPTSLTPALSVVMSFILTVTISIIIMLSARKIPKVNRYIM